VQLTQTLYARGEVTFLSLLQAQKILTETELAFVEAQAERWTSAVLIADLLQLEQFPPAADAPATITTNDTVSELRTPSEQAAADKAAPTQPPRFPAQPPAGPMQPPAVPAQPLPGPPAR
jgi:hypothetical protein